MKEILDRLREARFLAAGATEIENIFDALIRMVSEHDFKIHEEASMHKRFKLLANDVFPGAAAKKIVPVEFPPDNVFRGKMECYKPAGVVFWTAAGMSSIPPSLLDEDLQRCFPQDPGVIAKLFARDAAKWVEAQKETASAEAVITGDALAGLFEQMDNLKAAAGELVSENSTLKIHNAELQKRLEELE